MLGQVADLGNVQVVAVLGLAWLVFVIWWMLDVRRDVRRIRETVEHGAYEVLSDFGSNEEDN